MKVLLDTSFIRHLDDINQLALISSATDNLGWTFVIPETVLEELSKKNIPGQINAFLTGKIVELEHCSDQESSLLPSVILSLDDGELEAICIINKCTNRKFLDYLLLTDDGPAQKKAGQLGINSLDIISFLLLLNQRGLFDKDVAIQSISILERGGYHIDYDVKTDFLKRLV